MGGLNMLKLSTREKEVLSMLGLHDEVIAERLFIAVPTVRTHIKNIRKKLECKTRCHSLAFAVFEGIIKREELIVE